MKSSYKLNFTEELIQKIKYLNRKFPKKEWSATLFYTLRGDINTDNFSVTAHDLFLEDIGSATYTEFEHTADTTHYMCNNEHLMSLKCAKGLIHSHNVMNSYYSGTDTATLKSVGKERLHFLSVVVNNYMDIVAKLVIQVATETTSVRRNLLSGETSTSTVESTDVDILDLEPNQGNESMPVIEDLEKRINELTQINEIKKSIIPEQEKQPYYVYPGYYTSNPWEEPMNESL